MGTEVVANRHEFCRYLVENMEAAGTCFPAGADTLVLDIGADNDSLSAQKAQLDELLVTDD